MEQPRKDGSTVWTEVIVKKLFDDQGQFTGYLGASRNISERKQMEEALRQSNARLQAIFDMAGVAIGLSDAHGAWLEANQCLLDMVGYTRDELLQLSYYDLTHPDDVPATVEAMRGLLTGQQAAYRLEKRYLHKDGHVVWVDLSVTPIRDEQGFVTALLSAGSDITARKQAESQREAALETLRETTANLRATFEAFPDLFFRLQADGVILDYRSGANEDLYLPPEVFLGKPIQSILPPPLGQQMGDKVRHAVAQPGIQTLEYALPLPVGEQYYEARFVPVSGGQVVSVIRNITRRRQAEEQISRLNLELEERVIARTKELQTVNDALQEDIRQRQLIEETAPPFRAALSYTLRERGGGDPHRHSDWADCRG